MLEHNLDDLLNYREEKIQVGGHRAFATAKILKDHRVYVLSALDQHMLDQMNFTPISTAREAINIVKRECGEEFKTYFIPDGKSILPIYDKNGCSQK
jgi:nickel-dependent lactate racemase